MRSALQKRGDSSKTQLAARGITAFQKGKCYPNKKFKMPVEGAVRVYKTGTTRHESGRRKKAMVILPGFGKYAENFKKDNTQSRKKSSAFTTGKKRSKFYGKQDFAKLFFLNTVDEPAIPVRNRQIFSGIDDSRQELSNLQSVLAKRSDNRTISNLFWQNAAMNRTISNLFWQNAATIVLYQICFAET